MTSLEEDRSPTQNHPDGEPAALQPAPARRERWRLYVDSAMFGVVIWLVANPVLTMLYPQKTPAIQSIMFGHKQLGLVFLVTTVLYYPAHILLARGVSMESARRVVRPVAGLFFIWAVFECTQLAFAYHRYAVIPVLAIAYLLYESRKTHAAGWRIFNGVVTLALMRTISAGTEDNIIRFFIFALVIYAAKAAVRALLDFATRKTRATEHGGALLLYALLAMAIFAAMMAGGTNAGNYTRWFPVMDNGHYATAFAMLPIFAVHVVRVRRWLRGERRKLLSLPAVALTLAGCLAVEARNIARYGAYAPQPIAAASTAVPIKVSPYTEVKGYPLDGYDDWYATRAESCATMRCHPEISAQHARSAHGRAFVNDVYQWELRDFIAQKGQAAADYCNGCHAPLGVIKYPGDGSRGATVDPLTTTDPAFTIGVGCVVCHRTVPEREHARIGNASLTIRPLWLEHERYLGEEDAAPRPYPDFGLADTLLDGLSFALQEEYVGKETPEISNLHLHKFLINASNDLHRKTYHLPKQDWEAICGACHVVKLPAGLSVDGKERTVHEQYLSYRESPYMAVGLPCAGCHQQRMLTYEIGYDTVSHNYLGAGASLPYTDPEGDRKLRNISLAFLAGIGDTDIEAVEHGDLPPCLDNAAEFARNYVLLDQRGETRPFDGSNAGLNERDLLKTKVTVGKVDAMSVTVTVTTVNHCIGHAFPSGGGMKGYLEVTALDAEGNTVGTYGGRGDDGLPHVLPTVLGSRVADKDGNVIADRRFWNASQLLYRRYLRPAAPESDTVVVPLSGRRPPARVRAAWYYLRPEFFRNRERQINTPIPPVRIGQAETEIQ